MRGARIGIESGTDHGVHYGKIYEIGRALEHNRKMKDGTQNKQKQHCSEQTQKKDTHFYH